jgi:hypothetical protein
VSASRLGLGDAPSGALSAPLVPVAESLREAIRGDDPTAVARFSELSARVDVVDLANALLAVEPESVARYESLGIPPDTTRSTLADVGRKLDTYGTAADRPWLVSLLRGDVLAFGRLQFEREVDAAGRALHIPNGGPLTPAAVDHSIGLSREFFGPSGIHCTSWLFDPALLALPETSNIAAFVHRFDVGPVEPSLEASESAARFVFRRPLADVLDPTLVVPKSRVERIVVEHLRSGAHWSEPRSTLRA